MFVVPLHVAINTFIQVGGSSQSLQPCWLAGKFASSCYWKVVIHRNKKLLPTEVSLHHHYTCAWKGITKHRSKSAEFRV